MSKLVIIDGNAILHRAFHALPPLTSNGEVVNALYGFLSMLLKIRDDLQPTHLVVCFDRPEPTFRKLMYVGYQAKRPKMDESLAFQIDLTKKAVSKMKIPLYELAGFEADDLIGSLAFQAKNQKPEDKIDEVIIVTGDRDILQLVDKTVKVYMPIQGLTLAKLYGEQEVIDKFGIRASQIVDYKALAGDASDNYPGVKGIGPKTASTLLKKYQTIEAIYKAIEKKELRDVSEKIVKALSEEVNEANMAKKLAKIKIDSPVTLKIDAARLPDFSSRETKGVFEDYNFRSLLKRIDKADSKKGAVEKKVTNLNQQLQLV